MVTKVYVSPSAIPEYAYISVSLQLKDKNKNMKNFSESNYRIVKRLDDKFYTEIVYQDGTDYQGPYDTLEIAAQNTIDGAMFWNHTAITADDIGYREQQNKPDNVPPTRKFQHKYDELQSLLDAFKTAEENLNNYIRTNFKV